MFQMFVKTYKGALPIPRDVTLENMTHKQLVKKPIWEKCAAWLCVEYKIQTGRHKVSMYIMYTHVTINTRTNHYSGQKSRGENCQTIFVQLL